MAGLAVGASAAVSGFFGMNLVSGLEAAARGFLTTVVCSLGLSASIFAACWRRFRSVSREQRSRLNDVQALKSVLASLDTVGLLLRSRPPLPADPSRLKFELQSLLASSGLPRFGAPPARAPRPHPRRCSRRTVPARAPFRLASGAKELALLGSILSRQRGGGRDAPDRRHGRSAGAAVGVEQDALRGRLGLGGCHRRLKLKDKERAYRVVRVSGIAKCGMRHSRIRAYMFGVSCEKSGNFGPV